LLIVALLYRFQIGEPLQNFYDLPPLPKLRCRKDQKEGFMTNLRQNPLAESRWRCKGGLPQFFASQVFDFDLLR
jgi:hypothetical protein